MAKGKSALRLRTSAIAESGATSGRTGKLPVVVRAVRIEEWASNRISAIANPCKQTLELGIGDANLTRWYSDPHDRSCRKECKQFAYKGTKGYAHPYIYTFLEIKTTSCPRSSARIRVNVGLFNKNNAMGI